MKSMMGIGAIIVGLIFISVGIFIMITNNRQVENLSENKPAKPEIEVIASKPVIVVKESAAPKELPKQEQSLRLIQSKTVENKLTENSKNEAERKGVEFEKFVVKKFNKDYFTLTEWTSDKFIDGIYAENTLGPDLVFNFSLRNISEELAVECKWRKKLSSKYEIVSAQQIKNYRNFEQKRNLPVFLILGVGGEPSAPEHLYIVPLEKIQFTVLNESFLAEFKQEVYSNFFYDSKVKSLTANRGIRVKEQS